MLAATITAQGFPMLQLEDKVSFALQCMEDFDVQELAVVKDDYFIGIVQKSDLLDTDEAANLMALSDQIKKIMNLSTSFFLHLQEFFLMHLDLKLVYLFFLFYLNITFLKIKK